jgi:hypothetical protein
VTITYDDPSSVPPLSPLATTFVADPTLSHTVEVDRTPVSIASPTAGPNRYTMRIPTETTVLSLGAASGTWKTDIGITGYTDNHIHFETKSVAKTVVSLGRPATTSAVTGYCGTAPVSTHGYSMVTAAKAWHDAKLQHYLLSTDEDILMRTKGENKRAVIQAQDGFVDLNGGLEINLAAAGVSIGARKAMPMEDAHPREAWTGETPKSLAAKRVGTLNAILAGLATAHSLVKNRKKVFKFKPKGKLHSQIDTYADAGEWLADLGEFAHTVAEVIEGLSPEEPPEESIRLDAEVDISGAGGGEAAFFGVMGASLGSGAYTGVSGGLAASIKATLFAGVSAAYTSMKGYKKIEVGCDHGEMVFEAKQDVLVSAEKSVIAVGKEVAQVSSEKAAYFAGEKKAWIGTTAGGGWGAVFNASGVMIGKAERAGTMQRAKITADRSIKLQKGENCGVTLKSGSTEMAHTKRGTATKSKEVKLHAKDNDVRVAAKKVLIDGP